MPGFPEAVNMVITG